MQKETTRTGWIDLLNDSHCTSILQTNARSTRDSVCRGKQLILDVETAKGRHICRRLVGTTGPRRSSGTSQARQGNLLAIQEVCKCREVKHAAGKGSKQTSNKVTMQIDANHPGSDPNHVRRQPPYEKMTPYGQNRRPDRIPARDRQQESNGLRTNTRRQSPLEEPSTLDRRYPINSSSPFGVDLQ